MAQQILHIIRSSLQTGHPELLVFPNMNQEVASQILESLEKDEHNSNGYGFR